MSDLSPEVVDLEPQHAIAVRGDVAIPELPKFFERAYGEAFAAAEAAGVEIIGPPFGFYPERPSTTVAVEAGFPVSGPVQPADGVHPLVLPGGRAVVAVHVGPYEALAATYTELQAWMAHEGLHPSEAMWECYLSDPRSEPDPATWRTRIVWPIG